MTNWRWWIVTLLFFATTVNYMDRQVLSLTWKDFIAPEFHWDDNDYGTITAFFSIIYAICQLFAGKFVDWMGTKKGYLWAIGIWSAGACVHALCGWATMHIEGYESVAAMAAVEKGSAAALAISSISVWMFMAARAILALGEAGNFPAAIKTTAEYFPKRTVHLRHLSSTQVRLWVLLPLRQRSRYSHSSSRTEESEEVGRWRSSSSEPSDSCGWDSGLSCMRNQKSPRE